MVGFSPMQKLFDDQSTALEFTSKLESMFDSNSNQNLLEKVAETYLVYLEEFGYEAHIEEIMELAEEYGHDLSNLEEEIQKNM